MSRAPRSLQGRLLQLVLGVVIAVWLSTVTLTWFDARHELDELLDSHLAQAAALLVAQQASELGDGEPDIDAPILHRYAPRVAFQVFHAGRLALRSASAPLEPMVASGQGLRSGFATVQIRGTTWRVFSAYGAERDVRVYVGELTSSRASILWAVLRSMLWPMAVALPVLALAAWWAVLSGLAPLRRLGRTLAERQPEVLASVAFDDTPAEMLPMIFALNRLFERIGALLESERRFTADAAHELRTPIAAIRAQAQVAMSEPGPESRAIALQKTLEGCDRATRLVEQLLTLSRLEAVAVQELVAVDLSALTRSVVAELASKALGKQQTLEFDGAQSCNLPGNETLLAMLVRNLVDNAVRYSPLSATVKVRVQQQADLVTLSVDDSGPGLTELNRQRLGERFFRVPGSAESGSGLGWSIVRRIASVHRLDLQVERSAELGGLGVRAVFRSTLPVARTD
jgi:two-component system sensor histidine kinase QseC